jgi:hypothetical protein
MKRKCCTRHPTPAELALANEVVRKKLRTGRVTRSKKRKEEQKLDLTDASVSAHPIRVGVVWHIGYRPDGAEADIAAALAALNEGFNGQDPVEEKGRAAYRGTRNESQFEEYASRKGSLNVEFYTHDTKYAELPSNINADDSALEASIKNELSPVVDPSRYVNVWVVDGMQDNVLGWATFPFGMDATQGLVLNKIAFGADLGHDYVAFNHTLVHEMGHYFGAFHVFQYTGAGADWYDPAVIDYDGDGLEVDEATGDCVSDTPYQARPLFTETFVSRWPSVRYNRKRHYAMFSNFMAYSSDQVTFMFTKDQCLKMRLFLETFRPLVGQAA